MAKKCVFKKSIWSLVLFNLVATLTGCIGDPIYHPQKVRGLPNTFRLPGSPTSDVKILAVSVGGQGKHLWKITAIRDIPVKGFIITAGEVPEGFKQIIPPSTEKFKLVTGESYAIYIETNLKVSHLWQPATWVAE